MYYIFIDKYVIIKNRTQDLGNPPIVVLDEDMNEVEHLHRARIVNGEIVHNQLDPIKRPENRVVNVWIEAEEYEKLG